MHAEKFKFLPVPAFPNRKYTLLDAELEYILESSLPLGILCSANLSRSFPLLADLYNRILGRKYFDFMLIKLQIRFKELLLSKHQVVEIYSINQGSIITGLKLTVGLYQILYNILENTANRNTGKPSHTKQYYTQPFHRLL